MRDMGMREVRSMRIAGVVVLACAACEATPDVAFVDDDGAAPAPSASVAEAPPAGFPMELDAAVVRDAIVDAPVDRADAAQPATARDAGAAADSGSSGGGSGGAVDAGSTGGGSGSGGAVDAAAVDSGSVNGGVRACPTARPPGINECCGAVPCVGKKCKPRCDDCAACGASSVCCVPDGKGEPPIACVASAAECRPNGPGH